MPAPAHPPNSSCVHYFPYHLSVPYAGVSLELVVTLPVAPVSGDEQGAAAALWGDDDDCEGEEGGGVS